NQGTRRFLSRHTPTFSPHIPSFLLAKRALACDCRDSRRQLQTGVFWYPCDTRVAKHMARALTDIAINNLKPRAERYEVSDPGARGWRVVVHPSGAKSFIVRFRINGAQRKLTLTPGLSLAAARKLAATAAHDVAEGRDPTVMKREAAAKAASAKGDTLRAICE